VTILSACILLIVAKLPENYLFAGDKKILNENFEDRFKKGIVTINSCLYENEPFKALSHCVEKVKNQESKRTIWLVGDSHAFTLLNGIRGLAKRDKSDLRVVTRRATAFPQPVNFVKKRIKNIEEDIVSINFMNKAKETIIEQVKLQKEIEVPWHVLTKFGESAKKITIIGDQVSLTGVADFGTVGELRKAIEFYIDQLGGKVEWEDKG